MVTPACQLSNHSFKVVGPRLGNALSIAIKRIMAFEHFNVIALYKFIIIILYMTRNRAKHQILIIASQIN